MLLDCLKLFPLTLRVITACQTDRTSFRRSHHDLRGASHRPDETTEATHPASELQRRAHYACGTFSGGCCGGAAADQGTKFSSSSAHSEATQVELKENLPDTFSGFFSSPNMRDRLSHLQQIVTYHENSVDDESTFSETFSNVDLEDELPHEAVVFDQSPALSEVFSQSQDIHKEIQLIRLEVKRLREQNSRVNQGTINMSVIKKDSNAIGADIKQKAQGVLEHLHNMEETANKLEQNHGANSAITRIARTQYACLSNGFRDALFDYNEVEMSHRENCKAQILRQMEIVGRDVTGENVEDMIEKGEWNIFTDNIVSEGRTARSALFQIERRHQELMDLENRIKGIHEIFLDIALLVEEQGPMLNSIQTNVQQTDSSLQDVLVKLRTAKRHHSNNPFKKIFCGCFPCFK